MKITIFQKCCLIFIGFILTTHLFAATITNFRVATASDKTRLVFDATGPVDYVLFTLQNPTRIVIDFKNTDLIKHFEKNVPPHTPIKNIRLRLSKDFLRVVVDLKQPLQANSFLLPPKEGQSYRVVVDLTSTPLTIKETSPVISRSFMAHLPIPVRTRLKPIANVTAPATLQTPPQVSRHGRSIIVVIDPGHGGKDPGTTGYAGTHEKDVVLAIARDLQQYLNREPGFKAVLTRTGDYYIPLRGRLDLARKYKGDMFVSIHADAYPEPGALGASVFALSQRGATSEAARWLAEKENKSELLGGANLPDNDNVLRSVLIDLSQTNTISESLQIGSAVLFQLGKISLLHHPRVEQAAFVVLKSPDIPSILVETGFLSTPAQERQLHNPQYQHLIANAVMQGIKNYFVRNPLPGTIYASTGDA